MSHSIPVLTASLPSSSIIEGQPDQEEGVVGESTQIHSLSLHHLSATSAPVTSPKHVLSDDDDGLLVISPTRTYFVYERKPSTVNVYATFGCVVKRRLCSFYLMHWRLWCSSRKEKIAVLQDFMNRKALLKAFSSIETVYAQNTYNKTLIHWAWFKMQQLHATICRFRTCKALHEAFLLQRSFRRLQTRMLLMETLNEHASLYHRKTLLWRCLCNGLVPAYRRLVAASAQAALHHHLILRRVSFYNMLDKIRLLVYCEEYCASHRAIHLTAASFRSMLKVHRVFHKLKCRMSLALLQKSMDCWRYVFFRRLRVYVSYDAVSTRTDRHCISLALSMWYKQTKVSVIFHRWRRLYSARALVRKYSGTSNFDCFTVGDAGYSSTYKGVHPRVETLFRGMFNHLRDRAKLLLIKEKLIASMFKRKVFESIVLVYCKREASVDQNNHRTLGKHELDGHPIDDTLDNDSNCTETYQLAVLNVQRYVAEDRKDSATESGAHHTEFGVQVFSTDSHANPCQDTSIAFKESATTMVAENSRDFSTQAEPSYTSAELQRLNSALTHSPTTVRQIINKYRSQPINDRPPASKPLTEGEFVQDEECDEVYCITNIIQSPVQSPYRSRSPEQLSVLRQVHRVRPKQQLQTHFSLERCSVTGQRSDECIAASTSAEEISSVVYENQIALQIASPERQDGASVCSEIASPFYFVREHSASPVKANSTEHSPLVQMPAIPSELNEGYDCMLIEGPLSPSVPPHGHVSSEDPASDMFTGMQIISFTTGQLNESVIAPPAGHQTNTTTALGVRPLGPRLSASHPLPPTEAGSYRMLDTQYNLVSSFTEEVKKHLDTNLLTHSSDWE